VYTQDAQDVCVYTYSGGTCIHIRASCVFVCAVCVYTKRTRRMCVYAGFVFLTEPTPTLADLSSGTSTRTFLAYCGKGCTHTSTKQGGQGCRRPFNPDTVAGFGYCNPDKQVKCFYPSKFTCKCTSDNRSSEQSKRQPCVCPAAEFEMAVAEERAERDAAKKVAAAGARSLRKAQREADGQPPDDLAQLLLTDAQAADRSEAWGSQDQPVLVERLSEERLNGVWTHSGSGGVRTELDRDFNAFLRAHLQSLHYAESGRGVGDDGTGPSELEVEERAA